jgi:glycerophosphoryl diester phosphodiesterase
MMNATRKSIVENWSFPTFFAHRGAGAAAPENTLAAMELGAAHGYCGFEFDVKLSKDGVAILMHDDKLERTTNGHGAVADMDATELEKLDAGSWHSAAFAGTKIPRFSAVTKFLHGHGYVANVEIKPCWGREIETGRQVAEMCVESWQDRHIKPLISSFSELALEAARKVASDYPLGLLVTTPCEDHLPTLQALGCVSIHGHHESLDGDTTRFFHDHGYRVLTYTVNDVERAAQLLAWGVDGIFTDEIDKMAKRFPAHLKPTGKPMMNEQTENMDWLNVVPPMP